MSGEDWKIDPKYGQFGQETGRDIYGRPITKVGKGPGGSVHFTGHPVSQNHTTHHNDGWNHHHGTHASDGAWSKDGQHYDKKPRR